MRNTILILSLIILAVFGAFGQTSEITPSDNMVIEGIPPIPASIAEDIGQYTEIRSARFLSWHPLKREMLISTRFSETAQIHLLRVPGGARTQLTFFTEPSSAASFNPADGSYFVFSRDVGGNEYYQKYRYDLSSGDVSLLTDGKSRNTSGLWSSSGESYAYMSTRRNGQDNDIYLMDPSKPGSDRLLAELQGGGWFPLAWSSDDAALLIMEAISANESYLWLLDAKTGNKKLITPKGGREKVFYGGGAFSSDGKGIYTHTDKSYEFQRLAYIELGTGTHTFLTPDVTWDVDEFEMNEDRSVIAYSMNVEGFSELHLLDLKTGKELPVPQLPAGILGNMGWHRNNRDLAFTLSSASTPGDVYSLDIKTNIVQQWTFSETGGINTSVFREPEMIRWPSFDGKSISGILYRPSASFTGKRPVIINIHGGPESQSRAGFQGSKNYFINELGVAYIFPNIRGSSGYGKSFLALDNGFRREDSYKDINALFDWIQTQPDLDSDRIMIIGGSYGGHMVLAIATYYPDRFRCAVDIVGISNLVTFLENTAPYRRDLRRVEYGDERDPEMRSFLNRIAPLNNAGKISKPLFVVQGGNDPRVPLSEAEQIVRTLKEHSTPVWYLMAKDEGHGFARKKNQDYLTYAVALFVKEYLLK